MWWGRDRYLFKGATFRKEKPILSGTSTPALSPLPLPGIEMKIHVKINANEEGRGYREEGERKGRNRVSFTPQKKYLRPRLGILDILPTKYCNVLTPTTRHLNTLHTLITLYGSL